jgi:hypothetical protein
MTEIMSISNIYIKAMPSTHVSTPAKAGVTRNSFRILSCYLRLKI